LNKFRREVYAVVVMGMEVERGEEREKRLKWSRGCGRECLVSPAKRNAD
jgi:hypothetical protein